jgi:archaellum component FlaC
MEEKIFDLLTILHNDFKGLKNDVEDLKNNVKSLETKVDSIDKTVIRIENDNHVQHTALFDGWKQNTEQLGRIEKEVIKQDDFIMRRIK